MRRAEPEPSQPEEVAQAWSRVVDEQNPYYATISPTQKAILNHLAHRPEVHVTGSAFLNKLGRALSTVRDSFGYLKNMDMVYQNDETL